MTSYHQLVMLKECLEGLNIQPDGIYVDVTFGGGGHSKAILEKLGRNGKLIGFDQDPDAWEQAEKIDDERLTLITANFRYLEKYLRLHRVKQVDGILADFGVSSFQLDAPERGFSIRFDGPLDMRMGPSASMTAAELLNSYSAEELQRILGMYGEVKNARTLAQAIIQARTRKALETTQELKEILIEEHNGAVPQSFEALERLPAVGHKTASVVMSQAFGAPAFPVDTHIHRLMYRWNLSNGKSVQQTEKDAKAIFPRELWNDLHLQIIWYGREYSPARGWNLEKDIITKTIGRKSVLNEYLKKHPVAFDTIRDVN